MGQYFYVANLDKREYLHPHKFGDGLKLYEFGFSGGGTMAALALLLSTDRKGEWRGRWLGDRVAIVGDYAKHEPSYEEISESFRDVSPEMRAEDEELRERREW